MVSSSSIIILMILRYVFTLENITEFVFRNSNNGQLAAFGDFDSDALIDIFILTDKGRSVEIMFGSDEGPFEQPEKQVKCTFEHQITSVVPGDFNGDALMDVLVTVKNETGDKEITNDVYIMWGDLSSLRCPKNNQRLRFNIIDQPLIFDYDGDMIMDLFVVKKLPNSKQNMFWLFDSNGHFIEKPIIDNSKMRVPQSHGYVDVKGDVAPDLYLTTEDGYEIWVSDAGSFKYYETIPSIPNDTNLPQASIIGQSVFIDFQLRGRLDNVVPVCFDAHCKHSAIYFHDSNRWYNLNVQFGDYLRFVPPNTKPYLNTITLRPGDFNLDGFTDLLATVCGHSSSNKTQVVLLENVKCYDCDGFDRHFEIKRILPDSKNDDMNSYVTGAFYDFFQNGVLDLLLVSEADGEYKITALKNSLDYDANFLKVMVVSGLENDKYKKKRSNPFGKKTRTFGTNLPGLKVIYETKTYEGVDRKGVATQLPQSAHFSLHLPYTIFGLDRFCNFITTLNVSVLNETHNSDSIIPNSQIIIIPNPLNEPSRWLIKLFVTPSRIILQSALAFAGSCLLILFTIGVLHYKEQKLDRILKWKECAAISAFR